MPAHPDGTEPEEHSEGSRRRSQVFSLPFTLRHSTKRASVLDTPAEQATCEERVHYPVFDPADPRHNPSGCGQQWRRRESQTSSSDSQKQGHWIQDLPLRSLHKARSGLIALRAGLLRRSTRQSMDQLDGASSPQPQRGPRYGHVCAAFSLSGASTQEDLNFGYDLCREDVAWTAVSDDTRIDALMTAASVHTLNGVISSAALADSHAPLYHLETTVIEPVSTPKDQSPMSATVQSRESDFCHPKGSEKNADTVQLVPERSREISDICLTRSTSSGSRGKDRSFLDGSVEHANGRCDVEDDFAAESCSRRTLIDSGPPNYRSLENLELEREIDNLRLARNERELTDRSIRPFTLPDPDALSTLSSNTSYGRRLRVAQSEAFTTQECLLLPRESRSLGDCAQSIERSRQGSAEVRIAFPGVYQALVEQWVEESGGNTQMHPVDSEIAANTAPIEVTPSYQTSSAIQPAFSHNIPWQYGSHADREITEALCNQQTDTHNSIPFPSPRQPLAMDESIALPIPGNSSVGVGGSRGADELVQTHPMASAEHSQRYSFGLHMSLRSATGDRNRLSERSPRASTGPASPTDNRYSCSSLGLGGAIGSLCDESDFSTNYTRGSTTSAEVTSVTSMPGSAWSPLDSPIDEEVYFSGFFRDEYYIGDGKTSSHYPDRGDLPVKAARRVIGDGSLYSGPGLDRAPSYRTREMVEIRPGGTIRPSQPAMRALMQSGESESADDSTRGHQAQSRKLH